MKQERGCGCGVGVLMLIVAGVALVFLLPLIGVPLLVVGAVAALLGGWLFSRGQPPGGGATPSTDLDD